MKKKVLYFLLLCLFTLALSACKSESELNPGEKQTFDKLPAALKLNDSDFSLEDVSVYQSNVDYEWYIYATLSIDINNLDDEEKHWLDKDATELLDSDKIFRPDIYLTSEANSIDFDSMQTYGYSDIGEHRVYFFSMLNTYKNNFDDCETTAVINIKQDGTYEATNRDGEKYEKQKENKYTYNVNKNIKDISEMPEDVKTAFIEKLDGTPPKSNSSTSTSEKEPEETQSTTPDKSQVQNTPTLTTGQRNALNAAKTYLDTMAFSHSGLIEQLQYEGYSVEDATYAADNCGADWNEQAAKSAQTYLDTMSFSRDGLIEQLVYEGFSAEQAEYGATAVGY